MKITITEGLAEIKLITNKLVTKRAFVLANLVRAKHLIDPLGDSEKAMDSELQAIMDLEKRFVTIRSAIAQANIHTSITINEVTKTIFDWLSWKREISAKSKEFMGNVQANLKHHIDKAITAPQAYKDDAGAVKLTEIVTNVSYQKMQETLIRFQEVLDKLDGQLSLKNATILIEI